MRYAGMAKVLWVAAVAILILGCSGDQVLRSMLGSEGGVYKSADGGRTWSRAGLEHHTVSHLAIAPQEPDLMYAASSQALCRSDDGGATWNPASDGLGNAQIRAIAVDPNQANTLYAATDSGVLRSDTRGATWSATGYIDPGYRDVQHIVAPKGSPRMVYTCSGVVVHRSVDRGERWEYRGGVNQGVFTSAFAVDPLESEILYAGSEHGVYKSADGGRAWTAVNEGLLNTHTQCLAIDPQRPEVLYAGTTSGVFRSADGGRSWTKAGRLGHSVMVVVVDPAQTQVLYAVERELSRSADGGSTWSSLDSPAGRLPVLCLAVDRGGVLYLGGVDAGDL